MYISGFGEEMYDAPNASSIQDDDEIPPPIPPYQPDAFFTPVAESSSVINVCKNAAISSKQGKLPSFVITEQEVRQ